MKTRMNMSVLPRSVIRARGFASARKTPPSGLAKLATDESVWPRRPDQVKALGGVSLSRNPAVGEAVCFPSEPDWRWDANSVPYRNKI